MRGQRYRAKDKTVRKMGRDRLSEENLRSGERTRVGRRESDILALPGTAADSINFQERRGQRADRQTEQKKRRGGYSPDFRRPEEGAADKGQSKLQQAVAEEADFLLYQEDSGETEKDMETAQGVYADAGPETARQPDGEAGDGETGTRQEAAFYRGDSGRKKRYCAEPLAAQYRRRGGNTVREARSRQGGFPDTASGNRMDAGADTGQAAMAGTVADAGSTMPGNQAGTGQGMAADAGQAVTPGTAAGKSSMPAPVYGRQGQFFGRGNAGEPHAGADRECRTQEGKGQDRAHMRKKKQVYAYARKMKEQEKAEEKRAASARREEARHTGNRLAAGEALRVSGENAEKSGTYWRRHREDKRVTGRLSFEERDGMVRGKGRRLSGKMACRAAGAADSLADNGQEEPEEDMEAGILCCAGQAGEKAFRYALRPASRRMQKREYPAGEEARGGGRKKELRKFYQKQRNKKSYAKARREAMADGRQTGADTALLGKVKDAVRKLFRDKKGALAAAAAIILLFLFFAAGFSGCSAMVQGASSVFIGTTYPSRDEDIYAAEDAYRALEEGLDERIGSIETEYPGYDEYRYQVDEITHNPYQLISLLTVLYEEFTYSLVEGMDMLPVFFAEQYRLTVEEVTEVRTKTETQMVADPETGEEMEEEVEVEYEWRILCVCLENKGFDTVARNHMTQEQAALYDAYNMTYGNRSYLFGVDGLPADSPAGADYAAPPETLTDAQAARMIREAEKYLGTAYVWGGSSPETGFDCSGFVSWVINHCGNGWDVGRQTAEGLRGKCTAVSPSDAEPGDLVFFQGTYNTPGASHVGIYAGDGMMINAGSPVKYCNLNTPYWKGHFLSYGRIR